MDEMTISISDLLAVLARKGKQIILVAVIFAVLLGTFKGVTSWLKTQDEERFNLDQFEYDQQLLKLERTIEKASEDVAKKQEYIDNSLWMKIDPYNKYEASLYLSISDVDEHSLNMSFGYNETPVDYLTKQITSQYSILWSSFDLPAILGLTRFENLLDKYVREVVSMSVLDSGILLIRAIGNSEAEVKETIDAVQNLLLSRSAAVTANSYPHCLEEFNFVLKNQVDLDMADAQTVQYEQLDRYNDTIIEAENTRKQLHSPDSILVATIKIIIIGGVAGVLLACVWFAGEALLQGQMQSSSQVERALGIPFVGSIATPEGLFACTAARFSGERVWNDEAQALGYISETVKMRATGDQVLLLSTLPLDAQSESIQKVESALSAIGLKPICASDFSHNPDALVQLSNCNSVVLLETVGKTKLGNISEILRFAKELEKSVVGFVMV